MNKTMLLGATFAAVFVFTMMTNPVFASSPDLTVVDASAGKKGTLVMTVEGTAGGTTPEDPNDIYAYVFVTDAGLYAVTSHFGVDDDDASGDLEWHSHQVTLDGNGCVSDINPNGVASLDGNTITVTDTDAKKVLGGAAAVLSIDENGICVKHFF